VGVKRYDRQAGTYVRVEPVSGRFLDDELPAHVPDLSADDDAGEEALLAELAGLSDEDRAKVAELAETVEETASRSKRKASSSAS
jgi:hypothetical protein